MSKKVKRIIFGIGGCIVIFVLIMTWYYPFSPFSVYKSYSYQPYEISFNGESYEEILSEFRVSYEKDLKADVENEYPNLTIHRTEAVLSIFEQEWLRNKDAVSMDAMKLDTMLFEVKQVREVLLSLLVQVEYTSEERGYLVDIISNLLALEDSIMELQNEKYASRLELNRRFDNLYGAFLTNFRFYATFYERSH